MLTSIYTDHIDTLPPSQKDRPQTCDVAIIGGGLTGITAALHLAENGYDVALLEAETIGSGGSGRNGGHLCQGWPNDFHHISHQLSAHDADLAWAAGMAAVDMVTSRVRKHNIACDLQFGYLHAALHQRHMNELLALQDEWSHRGYAHLTLLTDRAALAPHINSQSYCGGLYDKKSGQIQPLKYLMGLALAARAAGADILEHNRVIKIDRGVNKTIHIEHAPKLTASRILLCGNAYLTDIGLPDMSRRLAQVTSSVLATSPLSNNMIQHILPNRATVADCNTALNYFRIDADNRMILAAVPVIPMSISAMLRPICAAGCALCFQF